MVGPSARPSSILDVRLESALPKGKDGLALLATKDDDSSTKATAFVFVDSNSLPTPGRLDVVTCGHVCHACMSCTCVYGTQWPLRMPSCTVAACNTAKA